mmetsp:Transcript_17580/g.57443  ORF Transcript_17580/g.57443 Transcript_17580/m.57443 type:complete len:327 (+) Transcript_17580:404-1384(+)
MTVLVISGSSARGEGFQEAPAVGSAPAAKGGDARDENEEAFHECFRLGPELVPTLLRHLLEHVSRLLAHDGVGELGNLREKLARSCGGRPFVLVARRGLLLGEHRGELLHPEVAVVREAAPLHKPALPPGDDGDELGGGDAKQPRGIVRKRNVVPRLLHLLVVLLLRLLLRRLLFSILPRFLTAGHNAKAPLAGVEEVVAARASPVRHRERQERRSPERELPSALRLRNQIGEDAAVAREVESPRAAAGDPARRPRVRGPHPSRCAVVVEESGNASRDAARLEEGGTGARGGELPVEVGREARRGVRWELSHFVPQLRTRFRRRHR